MSANRIATEGKAYVPRALNANRPPRPPATPREYALRGAFPAREPLKCVLSRMGAPRPGKFEPWLRLGTASLLAIPGGLLLVWLVLPM